MNGAMIVSKIRMFLLNCAMSVQDWSGMGKLLIILGIAIAVVGVVLV